MPAPKPERVVFEPVPDIAPGLIVQFPAGKPLNSTPPLATAQVGCVIMPTTGADGDPGCALITTLAEAKEIHPAALVTVKAYVPATSPDRVVLDPVPEIAPGLMIQFPGGKLVRTTLPVGTAQEGWVMAPIIGANGLGFTVTLTFTTVWHKPLSSVSDSV